MIIHVLARDGSPLGVSEMSVSGDDGRTGVGGAELTILTLCRCWHDKGHDVTLYNNPVTGSSSVFKQKMVDEFIPSDERDVLIVFRSPNPLVDGAKGKKIWFSCDQFTIDNFSEFAGKVDKIIGISPFHAEYFKTMYGIRNMQVIDIPVRDWEYQKTEKKKNSCIFTSVPDRGLLQLAPVWDRIVSEVPDATLTITSDWSLWTGCDVSSYVQPYRLAWAGKKNVTYRGAIKRSDLIKIQSEAEYHLYPCIYDELFCISVAESQVAGAIPITSRTGAIETTNRFGCKVDGNPTSPEFISKMAETFIELSKTPHVDIRDNAIKEFGVGRILDEWEKVFRE
jgi:glycosyltransferase involved in cell wall biosynthesis